MRTFKFKWLLIIGAIVVGILLLEGILRHERGKINKINARHTKTVIKYTIGVEKNLKQKINKAVKQGYKGLPMEPQK